MTIQPPSAGASPGQWRRDRLTPATGRTKAPSVAAPALRALAGQLCALGYDARPTSHDIHSVTAIEIHAVNIEGWRYPDGHWEFVDRPAQLLIDQHGRPDRLVLPSEVGWGGATTEVPSYASPAAVASWVAQSLPPPDQPHCQLFSSHDDRQHYAYPAPRDWEQRWRLAW
ncbi:hypothetical protein [Mycobacterium paragordonae]|uniref:hypothetical protein n=1 Tax=Mycobacterium paragordonae TaxID=1389713 RepID=UPI003987AED1